MRELLKKLMLDESVIADILSKHNEVLQNYDSEKKELQKQIDLSQNEIKTRDKQLKELSKIDVEQLNSKIKEFEKTNKDLVEKHNFEMESLKKDYAVEKALIGANARNIKATKSLLDLDNLKLDEQGNLKGLDEQIKALIEGEDTSFLFKTEEVKSEVKGLQPIDTPNISPTTKDVKNMSYTELCNYYENGGN